jgi:hypothetical protein
MRWIKLLWKLAETASTVVWLIAVFGGIAAGAAVTIGAAIYGAFSDLPKLGQVLAAIGIFVLAFSVALILIVLAIRVLTFALSHWRTGGNTLPRDPREELKEQLAEVDGVRTWLSLREDPDEQLPLDDDPVFQWAKKTYKLIQREFPVEADVFMGRSYAPLGSAYFATAYALRWQQMGRSEYLESRADMVREILRA